MAVRTIRVHAQCPWQCEEESDPVLQVRCYLLAFALDICVFVCGLYNLNYPSQDEAKCSQRNKRFVRDEQFDDPA
ncbi:MAG: hypothetical protein GY820_44205 [Gammaproteobacteria bacterium]|nr:hypothetical protein [Gammaproteobacteria bacterium]